jgi:hypothetical protein
MDKTKYMLMSCHQIAEQYHNIETAIRCSENVAKFKSKFDSCGR